MLGSTKKKKHNFQEKQTEEKTQILDPKRIQEKKETNNQTNKDQSSSKEENNSRGRDRKVKETEYLGKYQETSREKEQRKAHNKNKKEKQKQKQTQAKARRIKRKEKQYQKGGQATGGQATEGHATKEQAIGGKEHLKRKPAKIKEKMQGHQVLQEGLYAGPVEAIT